MPRLIHRAPQYRLHRTSGHAVVTLDGRDFYRGVHGTAASRQEYDRLVGEWLAAGRQIPRPECEVTVVEVVAAFWKFAKTYYRRSDGTATRGPGRST